jgi:hypothetical protein
MGSAPGIFVSNVSIRKNMICVSNYLLWFGSTFFLFVCTKYEAPDSANDDYTKEPYLMRQGTIKTMSYVHSYCLRIWFGLVGTLFSLCGLYIWGFTYMIIPCYISHRMSHFIVYKISADV